MKLFKKPKWLKPELDEPIYYAHIAVILGVMYGLMQLYNPGNNILIYGLFLIIGDGVAHTVLKMD
jgi:hypothetical protein